MSQVDAAGNWVNETKEVEEVEKTCINKTIVRGTMQVTTSQHCHTSHTRLYFF